MPLHKGAAYLFIVSGIELPAMMSFGKKKRSVNLKYLKTPTKTTVLVILFLGQLHEIPISHAWEILSFTEIPSHQILRDTMIIYKRV